MGRVILHCDANSFYASCELCYKPWLKDKPVAVGGDQEARHGIVLTANPIAKKKYGINSLDYELFGTKKHLKTKAVKFRNGGNDTSCRIKDAAISRITLLSGIDIDTQDYQPVM